MPYDEIDLRQTIEHRIVGRVRYSHDEQQTPSAVSSIENADVILNTSIDSPGYQQAQLIVLANEENITIQLILHQQSLPAAGRTISRIRESHNPVALSDFTRGRYKQYEHTLLSAITTELGRTYSGPDTQAVTSPDRFALVNPPPDEVYETASCEYSFGCLLDSTVFWEVPLR